MAINETSIASAFADLQEEYQAAMQQKAAQVPYDLYSGSQYPWWCLNYFLIFCFLSNLIKHLLLQIPNKKIRQAFQKMDNDKQNNTIIYVMQLLFTSVALVLQLYGSSDIVFMWKETTSEGKLKSLDLAVQTICILYIWELIFRKKIGFPLLIHHVCSIFLIQLSLAASFDTHDLVYVRFAVLLGSHATTEQLTFMALLFFRLNIFENWQDFWFFCAAAQSFLFKTIVTLLSIFYYIFLVKNGPLNADTSWGLFWAIGLVPLAVSLYVAQVYSCVVLYTLGKRCRRMGGIDSKTQGAIVNSSIHQDESTADNRTKESSSSERFRAIKIVDVDDGTYYDV